MKVLIAGAGPSGLTAGVELARRGIRVEIIERSDGISTLSRAVGINPRSLELLTPSGVTRKLLAQGVIYNHVRVYRGATLWATAPLTAAPIRHGYNIMLGLPQDQTEAILRDRFTALGGMIAYGVELSGIRQDQHGVIAETTDGGEWPADYLIGADGIRSAARPAIGIAANGVDLPDTWSIADADADWPHKHDATLCLMDQGQMAAIDTYQNGRVFLAGDSAHSQSPAGGRGMNLGIADSADLAHRLAHGDLQTYSAARHAEGKKVMAGAEQMRKIVTSTNPATPTDVRQ
jgi:2-polyprenyl-6-methoxyphenol hydroxylase-like FAD-dependent oxidoreductase